MGLYFGMRSCPSAVVVPAPAPNPTKWKIRKTARLPKAHVVLVEYPDCTNFEGLKILVFKGPYRKRTEMDPHFSEKDDSPIARFRPDDVGWDHAVSFARSI